MSSAESSPEMMPNEPQHLLVLWHYTQEEQRRHKGQQPAWRRLVPVEAVHSEENDEFDASLRPHLQNQLEQIRGNEKLITCPYARPDGRFSHTVNLHREYFFQYSGITSAQADEQEPARQEPEGRSVAGGRLGQLLHRFLGNE
jgi:hypothetical protein